MMIGSDKIVWNLISTLIPNTAITTLNTDIMTIPTSNGAPETAANTCPPTTQFTTDHPTPPTMQITDTNLTPQVPKSSLAPTICLHPDLEPIVEK